MQPSDAIEAGRQILDQAMVPAGFAFTAGTSGTGSGGDFASAAYVRGERRLDFSYRHALGAVEYHIGQSRLDHDSYMRLLGAYHQSEYCRFSRDVPIAGFEALRHDLEQFCSDFLTGSGEEFRELADRLRSDPNCVRGFGAAG